MVFVPIYDDDKKTTGFNPCFTSEIEILDDTRDDSSPVLSDEVCIKNSVLNTAIIDVSGDTPVRGLDDMCNIDLTTDSPLNTTSDIFLYPRMSQTIHTQ